MHRRQGLTALGVMFVVSLVIPFGRAQQQQPSRTVRVEAAMDAVLRHYNPTTGLFDTAGWWNAANGITALADAARLPGSAVNSASTIDNTFRHAQKRFPGFLNGYYDDEGWWALAWIAVYDLDHRPERLKMAEAIFENMTGGWDTVCGGGIWWKKDRHYKNAIANELFLSVAAKLAQHTMGKQRQRYLKWASDEWRWFAASGMINDQHVINDGLDDSCHNNRKEVWSYNQGVVLSGLAALGDLQQDPKLLEAAFQIAEASMTVLSTADGVLHDVCEPRCGADGVQFKGIYVRNLAYLNHRKSKDAITAFLHRNANALWLRGHTAEGEFGVAWSGPPASAGAGTDAGADIAALDLFVADFGP